MRKILILLVMCCTFLTTLTGCFNTLSGDEKQIYEALTIACKSMKNPSSLSVVSANEIVNHSGSDVNEFLFVTKYSNAYSDVKIVLKAENSYGGLNTSTYTLVLTTYEYNSYTSSNHPTPGEYIAGSGKKHTYGSLIRSSGTASSGSYDIEAINKNLQKFYKSQGWV